MDAKEFVVDYIERHVHPVNALLHIVGVPAVLMGLYCLFANRLFAGLCLIVCGYILQYIGHRAQGNEVGEVTLIKHIVRTLKRKVGGHG